MVDINEIEIVKSSTVTDGLSQALQASKKYNQIEKLKELRLFRYAEKTGVNQYVYFFFKIKIQLRFPDL